MECRSSVQHVQQLQQAGEYERDKHTTWCKHSENAEISQSLIKLLFHQLFRYQFYSLKLHQNVDLTQQNELSVRLYASHLFVETIRRRDGIM